MSYGSLSFKVALIGSIAVALVIGIVTFYLLDTITAVIDGQSADLEQKTIATEAALVRDRLNLASTAAGDLASTFEMLKVSGVKDRAVYDAVLRASADLNQSFLGTWAGWEPNALDGRDADFANKDGSDKTGRFLAYWNRTSGAIKRDVLSGYETDDYYVAPQKFGRAVVVEPYFYDVNGKSDLIMSLGVPLKIDSKTVGTIGVDVDLTRHFASLANVKPFGTGYLSVVSAGGMAVIHPDPKVVGKPVADVDKPTAEVAKRAIATKTTARLDAVGPNGELLRYIAEPIQASEAQEVWAAVAAVPLATLQAATTRVRSTMLWASGLSVGLVGLLLFGLLRTLMGRPLRALGRTVDAMAAGDYDRDVGEARRSDEVGVIGKAVERFREGLKARAAREAEREAAIRTEREAERRALMTRLANQFEGDVGGVVDLVSAAASHLQATATSLTSVASHAAMQSGIVNDAAREASVNVASVASSATQLGTSVEEMGRQVARSAAMSREAVGEANASAAVIDELSDAAKHIGDIVKLISAIAHQTNLLALNATIEASRAGEAGRGFAVVATEVKELSTQTASATAAIVQQIEAIQGSAARAVETINAISSRIRTINDTTVSVSSMVESQGIATLDIVTAVRHVSAGTDDVTTSISSVADAAQETGDAAAKVLAAASDLTLQSEQLRAEVRSFVASVRAA
jgi:methyl-accepting chemotaxis protein